MVKRGRGRADTPPLAVPEYPLGEISFFLSLTRAEARYLDEGYLDSCAHLSADPDRISGSAEGPDLPYIVRWHDVHEARRRVVARKRSAADDQGLDREVGELVGEGMSQREVAAKLGTSQATVHRRLGRWRGTIEEIQAELHGGPVATTDTAMAVLERSLTTFRRQAA